MNSAPAAGRRACSHGPPLQVQVLSLGEGYTICFKGRDLLVNNCVFNTVNRTPSYDTELFRTGKINKLQNIPSLHVDGKWIGTLESLIYPVSHKKQKHTCVKCSYG